MLRMLSLAAFAVLALAIGGYEEDGMTLLIGGASALAAVASLPRWRLSTFLTLLMDLFAAETVLFGLADLVTLLGYWPHGYEEYQLPSYLPLATALFMVVIFGVSYFPVVRKIMALADPFFDARTPISIRPWPLGPDDHAPEPLRADLRLLPDPRQPVPGGDRRAPEFLLPRLRQRHSGSRREPPDCVLASAHRRLHAPGDDLDPGFPARVLCLAQLRAAVAALDDGFLYLALAHGLDALQAGAERQPAPTTPTSASRRT